MNKFDIVIDCDGVITNTVKMFIELNNKLNNMKEDWTEVRGWDFHPLCSNLKTKRDVDDLFNHEELYENPIFFRDCVDVINRLNKKHNITICTMGENKNIRNKLKMFEKYLPDVNVIPFVSSFKIYNKDSLKTRIIIDDHIRNLNTNSAELKILFEPYYKYDWNEKWNGKVAVNWEQIERMVDEYLQ